MRSPSVVRRCLDGFNVPAFSGAHGGLMVPTDGLMWCSRRTQERRWRATRSAFRPHIRTQSSPASCQCDRTVQWLHGILVNDTVVATGPNTSAYDLRARVTAGISLAAGDLVKVQVQRVSTFGTTVYAGAKFAIV